MEKEEKIEDRTAVDDDDGWVGEGGEHEYKDSSMGFTMIYIRGCGANGGGKDMCDEMMRPRGILEPRGLVGVNGKESCGSHRGASMRVMGTIGGKNDG